MRRIIVLLLSTLLFIGCSKDNVSLDNLTGTWGEEYDSSEFAFDGVLRYCFKHDGTYTLFTSDPSGQSQHTNNGTYTLGASSTNCITINPTESDAAPATYVIVKLTSNEMAWQRQGTTYSKGTWGSDYRHFVKIK